MDCNDCLSAETVVLLMTDEFNVLDSDGAREEGF